MIKRILGILLVIGVVFLVAESYVGEDSRKTFNAAAFKIQSKDDQHLHNPQDHNDDEKDKDKDSKKQIIKKIVGQVMKWYEWQKEIEEKNNPEDKEKEKESIKEDAD